MRNCLIHGNPFFQWRCRRITGLPWIELYFRGMSHRTRWQMFHTFTHAQRRNKSFLHVLSSLFFVSLSPSFFSLLFCTSFHLCIYICVCVCVYRCVCVISSLTLYLFFASEYLLQDFFLTIRTNSHLSSRWLDDKSFTCALYKPFGLEKPSKWRISWLIKGSRRSSMKEKWEDVEKDERVFWLM